MSDLIVALSVRVRSAEPGQTNALFHALNLPPAQLSERSAAILAALASSEVLAVFRVCPLPKKSGADRRCESQELSVWSLDHSLPFIVGFDDGTSAEIPPAHTERRPPTDGKVTRHDLRPDLWPSEGGAA